MSRATDRCRARKDAEDRFPFKVDVLVPTYGETWPFVEMLTWCRDNVPKGAWEEHSFMDKSRRDERGVPIDFCRFYFMQETDAVAFTRRWVTSGSSQVAVKGTDGD
jgi:hypothetical protein